MDDRPFYELDDEELLLAEATQAALSSSRVPLPQTTSHAQPGVVLYSPLQHATYQHLQRLAQDTPQFTIIDHAQLINTCACALDRQDQDIFGLSALLRYESSLLQLDRVAPGEIPRSMNALAPLDVITLLSKNPPTDHVLAPNRLACRLSASDILALMHIAEESNRFFAFRRLSLALLPTLTRCDILADALKQYTFTLRIFINALAARWTLMPWSQLRNSYAEDADLAARTMIQALRHELDDER